MEARSGSESLYEEQAGTPVRQDYQRADTRWEKASPARDWMILLLVIVLHTAWMLVVFFFEPGIR